MQHNYLVKTKQNENVDHEERFTPEEVEFGDSTSALGATLDSNNDGVYHKMSPLISLSGMYRKIFFNIGIGTIRDKELICIFRPVSSI